MNEETKIAVEQVDSVPAPPRARVDDAESPAEKLERKRDYLEGFLAEKPSGAAPGEPGGDGRHGAARGDLASHHVVGPRRQAFAVPALGPRRHRPAGGS